MHNSRKLERLARAVRLTSFAAAIVLPYFSASASSDEQNAAALQPILAKAQDQMEQFVDQFGTMRCDEHIVQQKLKADDKVQYGQETVYDSFIMIHFEEGKIRVFEQHAEEKFPRKPVAKPLVTTHGFSTLAIIFHPYYAPSFRFSRLADDTLGGHPLARIHFEHIPGTPSPAIYQKFVGDQAIEFSGTAWIDPSNGRVYRLEADSGSSLKEMGLKDLRAQLNYGPISLEDETEPRWLPVSATVDLETPRQHWRNIHHFTDYRKYRSAVKLEQGTQQ
jgi:hypothetical protein